MCRHSTYTHAARVRACARACPPDVPLDAAAAAAQHTRTITHTTNTHIRMPCQPNQLFSQPASACVLLSHHLCVCVCVSACVGVCAAAGGWWNRSARRCAATNKQKIRTQQRQQRHARTITHHYYVPLCRCRRCGGICVYAAQEFASLLSSAGACVSCVLYGY